MEEMEQWSESRGRGRCSIMAVKLQERHREGAPHPSQAKHHLVKAVVNAPDHKLHLFFAFAADGSQRLQCTASASLEPASGTAHVGRNSQGNRFLPARAPALLACSPGLQEGLRDSPPPHTSTEPLAFVSLFPSLFLIHHFF